MRRSPREHLARPRDRDSPSGASAKAHVRWPICAATDRRTERNAAENRTGPHARVYAAHALVVVGSLCSVGHGLHGSTVHRDVRGEADGFRIREQFLGLVYE